LPERSATWWEAAVVPEVAISMGLIEPPTSTVPTLADHITQAKFVRTTSDPSPCDIAARFIPPLRREGDRSAFRARLSKRHL
jgi:hypothetical protein